MTPRALIVMVLPLLACATQRPSPTLSPAPRAYASFPRAFPAIARSVATPVCAPEQRLSNGHCCDPDEVWDCAWGHCACRPEVAHERADVRVPEALEIARPCMRAAATLDEASCCVVAAMQQRRSARESAFVRMSWREGESFGGASPRAETCRRRYPHLPW